MFSKARKRFTFLRTFATVLLLALGVFAGATTVSQADSSSDDDDGSHQIVEPRPRPGSGSQPEPRSRPGEMTGGDAGSGSGADASQGGDSGASPGTDTVAPDPTSPAEPPSEPSRPAVRAAPRVRQGQLPRRPRTDNRYLPFVPGTQLVLEGEPRRRPASTPRDLHRHRPHEGHRRRSLPGDLGRGRERGPDLEAELSRSSRGTRTATSGTSASTRRSTT